MGENQPLRGRLSTIRGESKSILGTIAHARHTQYWLLKGRLSLNAPKRLWWNPGQFSQ
jgi:hypothetical protein